MYNTSSMALGGDGLALDSAVGSSDLVMRTLVLGWRSHSSETLPLDACYDRTPQQGGAEDRLAWASAVPPPGAAHGSDYVNAPLLGASDSSRTPDSVPVFVMLPLDTVRPGPCLRWARAVAGKLACRGRGGAAGSGGRRSLPQIYLLLFLPRRHCARVPAVVTSTAPAITCRGAAAPLPARTVPNLPRGRLTASNPHATAPTP
jgi:hypothetical protein